MPEKMCKKKHLTSFQLIILGFAGVILLGSILLMLPVSSLDKVPHEMASALCPKANVRWQKIRSSEPIRSIDAALPL